MRLAVKKLEVRDAGELVTLVTENIESLEQGLTVIDSRLLLGHATIDVAAVDANGTLVLIALGRTADEAMLLTIVDAYSWCLEYPEAVRRVHPALRLSPERPPRVLFVVERMPDSFQRKMKQLSFRSVGCVEFRHIEVNGVRAVLFDCVAQLGQPLIAGPAGGAATAPIPDSPVAPSGDPASVPPVNGHAASAAGIQAALEHAIASAASRLSETPDADGTGLRAILDEIAKARLEPVAPPPACESESETELETLSSPAEQAAAVEAADETFSVPEMEPSFVPSSTRPSLVPADENATDVEVRPTAALEAALELDVPRTLELESALEPAPLAPVEPTAEPLFPGTLEASEPSVVQARPAESAHEAAMAANLEVPSSIKLSVVQEVAGQTPGTPGSAFLQGLLDEVSNRAAAPVPAEPTTIKPVPTPPAWAKAPATPKPVDGAKFPAPPTAARTAPVSAKPAAPASIAPAKSPEAPVPAAPGGAVGAEAAKEPGAELPAEFDNLKFPKDGVLTRQWMDFLNQMAASK